MYCSFLTSFWLRLQLLFLSRGPVQRQEIIFIPAFSHRSSELPTRTFGVLITQLGTTPNPIRLFLATTNARFCEPGNAVHGLR